MIDIARVCNFDPILPVLFLVAFNVLTITACHLPLYQCVAIAFQILVLSVRFIIPSVVQCYLVHCLKLKYLVNRTAYDESAAWCHVPHGLKKGYEIAEQKKHKILVDLVGRDSWRPLQLLYVDQCFPNCVPRQTGVPLKRLKCAVKVLCFD